MVCLISFFNSWRIYVGRSWSESTAGFIFTWFSWDTFPIGLYYRILVWLIPRYIAFYLIQSQGIHSNRISIASHRQGNPHSWFLWFSIFCCFHFNIHNKRFNYSKGNSCKTDDLVSSILNFFANQLNLKVWSVEKKAGGYEHIYIGT